MSNILIDGNVEDAVVLIIDLGIAIQLKNENDTQSFNIGTRNYKAPEVILSQAYNF